MKQVVLLAGTAFPVLAQMSPIVGHWDITPIYSQATDSWTWQIEEGGVVHETDEVFFSAKNEAAPVDSSTLGIRLDLPEDPAFDFFGSDSGQVWLFPQGGSAVTQPGFGDTQVGVFSENLEIDLVAVQGPASANFSLYESDSFGNFTIHMKTVDGISAADRFSKPLGHTHVAWGFSKPGLWKVDLAVQGDLGSGQAQPTSVGHTSLYFAIGAVARWRAENFEVSVVMDESVAGDEADPDGDGLSNLAEYLTGGDPNRAGVSVHSDPAGLVPGVENGDLTVTFARRDPAGDDGGAWVPSAIEWSDDLSAPWTVGGQESAAVPFQSGWERVTVQDDAAATPSRRFARLRVRDLETAP